MNMFRRSEIAPESLLRGVILIISSTVTALTEAPRKTRKTNSRSPRGLHCIIMNDVAGNEREREMELYQMFMALFCVVMYLHI